jgi:transposase
MSPISYHETIMHHNNPKQYRIKMVQIALSHGVKPAARVFNTTPKTIRKWVGRYQPGSMHGLEDLSKAPKHPRRSISPEQKQLVIQIKKSCPSFGAKRIKDIHNLSISIKSIHKIWKSEGLLKTKRRKHQTKNDLRKIKAQWRLFEQISMDTKDLDDIPEFWPQIRRARLPKVQYTAREVVSGLQFIAYAQERSLIYSSCFVNIIIQHLLKCGIRLDKSRIHTDNGSEFIGSWNAKQDSSFTRTIHKVKGLDHTTIPPGAHSWQADVETVHNLIEDEFYEVESFQSKSEFLQKATSYIFWFNLVRKNSYKNNRTPWAIIQDRMPKANPLIPVLPPVFLDALFHSHSSANFGGGYHVGYQP